MKKTATQKSPSQQTFSMLGSTDATEDILASITPTTASSARFITGLHNTSTPLSSEYGSSKSRHSKVDRKQATEAGVRMALFGKNLDERTVDSSPHTNRRKDKEREYHYWEESSASSAEEDELFPEIISIDNRDIDDFDIDISQYKTEIENLQIAYILDDLLNTRKALKYVFSGNCKGFLSQAKDLPFDQIINGKFKVEKNERLVLGPSTKTLYLSTARDYKPRDSREIKKIAKTNRRVYRAFQGYLLAQNTYSPAVLTEIWRPNSNIEIAYKAGAPLTPEMIRDTICQAEELQIQYEITCERWGNGKPPPPLKKGDPRMSSFHSNTFEDIVNSFDVFGRLTRFVWKPVISPILKSRYPEIVERLENKYTIIGFMRFLEESGIDSSICNCIFQKYFEPTFLIGKPALSTHTIANLYKIAHTLKESKVKPLTKSKEIEKRFKLSLLRKSTQEERFSFYIERWHTFLATIGLGYSEVIPKDEKQAEEHREFLLALAGYIAATYGQGIAKALWPKLQLFFIAGIKPSSDQIIPILNQAKASYESLQETIKNYIDSYLPNVPLVRRDIYGEILPFWMERLRKRVEKMALRHIKREGTLLAKEELDELTRRCYAWISAHAFMCQFPSVSKKMDSDDLEAWKVARERTYKRFLRHLSVEDILKWKIESDGRIAIEPRKKERDERAREDALRERIRTTDTTGLLTHAKLNNWAQIRRENSQRTRKVDEPISDITVATFATKVAPKAPSAIATMATYAGMLELAAPGQHTHPEIANLFSATTLEAYAAGVGAGIVGTLLKRHSYQNNNQQHAQVQVKRKRLQSEYRLYEIKRAALIYGLAHYENEKLLRNLFNLSIQQRLPKIEELEDCIDELEKRMIDIQGELFQKDTESFDIGDRWQARADIATNTLSTFSSGNFLAGLTTSYASEAASNAFLTVAAGGFFASSALGIVSNGYATYDSYRKEKNCKKAQTRTYRALNRHFNTQMADLENLSRIDTTYRAHQKYRQAKMNSLWRLSSVQPLNANSFISDDPYSAILRSFYDHQKTADHSFNKKLNGVKTTGSILGTGSALYLLITKAGAASAGTGAATSVITSSLVLTGIASMGISVILGGLGVLGFWYYRRRKDNAQRQQVEDRRQAYRYHEGPYWRKLKAHGLTDEEAEAIAEKKLLQKDLDLSLTRMAIDLQNEYQTTTQPGIKLTPQLTTEKIKELFRPHKKRPLHEMNPTKRQANYLWERNLRLLSQLRNLEEIKTHLQELFIPAG